MAALRGKNLNPTTSGQHKLTLARTTSLKSSIKVNENLSPITEAALGFIFVSNVRF